MCRIPLVPLLPKQQKHTSRSKKHSKLKLIDHKSRSPNVVKFIHLSSNSILTLFKNWTERCWRLHHTQHTGLWGIRVIATLQQRSVGEPTPCFTSLHLPQTTDLHHQPAETANNLHLDNDTRIHLITYD